MRSFFLNYHVRKIGDTQVAVSFLKRGAGNNFVIFVFVLFSYKVNSISQRSGFTNSILITFD